MRFPLPFVCQFCRGRGCLACDAQRKKYMAQIDAMNKESELEREFAFNNPLEFKTDNPEDMARLKDLFGADALQASGGIERAMAAFPKRGDA